MDINITISGGETAILHLWDKGGSSHNLVSLADAEKRDHWCEAELLLRLVKEMTGHEARRTHKKEGKEEPSHAAIWKSQGDEQVWRVAQHADSSQGLGEVVKITIAGDIRASVLLLDELPRTIGEQTTTTAIIEAESLRRAGVHLTRGLSWDRTLEEIATAIDSDDRCASLAECQHVYVLFGHEGVVFFSRDDCEEVKGQPQIRHSRVQFVRAALLCSSYEGSHAKKHPGNVPGLACILMAAVTRHLIQANGAPRNLMMAASIVAMREAHEKGAGSIEDDPKISLPISVAAEAFKSCREIKSAPILDFVFPFASYSEKLPYGIGKRHGHYHCDLLRDYVGGGEAYTFARAADVVLRGPDKALARVPQLRIGNLFTVDREEIERLRALRNMLENYERGGSKQPFSFAVFGPPGSGKSFAVKQLLKSLFPKRGESLTFNLSQFNSTEQLEDAFHRIRDVAIEGKVPFIFWDEFDAEGGKWLKHFLAPMQDGEFQTSKGSHPIGRGIFVFAGGTRDSFAKFQQKPDDPQGAAEWKYKKVPDFISRLRGYLDVKGPNPQGPDDVSWAIRRAILLRHALGKHTVDSQVLNAFIRAREFLHGARSLSHLISMCTPGGDGIINSASLPTESLLRMHVSDDFLSTIGEVTMPPNEEEELAAQVHESWRKKKLKEGASNEEVGPQYEDLPEIQKEQSRRAARDCIPRLEASGYELCYTARSEGKVESFGGEIIEEMMENEHDRWMREKLLDGFQWAAKSDRELGLHEDVAHFSHIPKNHQEYDRAIVKALRTFLEERGMGIRTRDGSADR